MLLLVSWWNKNSKENVRHGNVICLTEGKSINARSKSAVREGILKNSETVKEDGSVKAADGFQTWDNRQIWTDVTRKQRRAGNLYQFLLCCQNCSCFILVITLSGILYGLKWFSVLVQTFSLKATGDICLAEPFRD